MNISIVGRHLDLTEAIKSRIHDKVSKLGKIISPINDVHVTISVVKKYIHVAEITLTTHKEVVKGLAESEDMYVSIDMAVDKVAHHLEKLRDKLKDHKGPSLKQKISGLMQSADDAE